MFFLGSRRRIINCILLVRLYEMVVCTPASHDSQSSAVDPCAGHKFHCFEQGCIPLELICNGEDDCGDSSDEAGCSYPTAVCGSDEFQCADGGCVLLQFICDGDSDCSDHSDEAGCTQEIEDCGENDFQCSDGQCVPSSDRCDTEVECHDGSDEQGCPICPSYMFQCVDFLSCIPIEWRCDGDTDCTDRSDELICGVPTADPGFTCSDGKWIPSRLQCDSIQHCFGGEDEIACTECANDGFLCIDGRCIDDGRQCDGVNDCGDWSDEPPLCLSNCVQGIGQCEQGCLDLDGVVSCQCHDGYELYNTTHCQDIDECSAESNPCPGSPVLCENTLGSYSCVCPPGFIFSESRKTCYSTLWFSPSLIFASRRHVVYLNQPEDNTTDSLTPAINLNHVVALDFSSKEGCIFLSANQKIMRLALPSPVEPSVVADVGVEAVDGMAFDWVYENLYFTEKHGHKVEVIDIKSLVRHVLFNTELDEPRAIAVDPKRGYLYFSDCGLTFPKIEKAAMDGSSREVIISDNLQWPNGLCIEYQLRRLFWVNAFWGYEGSYIASSDLDGGDINILVEGMSRVKQPFAITVLQDKFYWTDWGMKGVMKANSFTGVGNSVILTTSYSPRGIRIFNRRVQDSNFENTCPIGDDACSHMCLAAPGERHYSCSCPDHTILAEDGKTCLCNDSRPLSTDGKSCGDDHSTESPKETTQALPAVSAKPVPSFRFRLPMNCVFEDRVMTCESKVIGQLPAEAPMSIECLFSTATGSLRCRY